jgi:ribosome-associated toxin RatA of RatAB toxin-antitoxin module
MAPETPMEVHKTALVGYSADRMFDLIEAAEHYPAFLPWCSEATILERTDDIVSARIVINYHGVKFDFVTRNPKRRPEWMAVDLEQGPFKRFAGEWHLRPLSDAGCKIEFLLKYEFANALMARVAGPVFERIADTLVDAFVTRAAEQLRNAPAAPPPEAAPAAPREAAGTPAAAAVTDAAAPAAAWPSPAVAPHSPDRPATPASPGDPAP